MNKSIISGVTGFIDAYKNADVVSGLVRTEHNVNIVMIPNAAKFVMPFNLKTLSKISIIFYTFFSKNRNL